jgi:hypothetical protein
MNNSQLRLLWSARGFLPVLLASLCALAHPNAMSGQTSFQRKHVTRPELVVNITAAIAAQPSLHCLVSNSVNTIQRASIA